MTIATNTVGTPQQPTIPANQIATIQVDAITSIKIPSSAGVPSFNQYWFLVNSMNPGIWLMAWFDPSDINLAQTLTNAAEQEWVSNPGSGHNTVLS